MGKLLEKHQHPKITLPSALRFTMTIIIIIVIIINDNVYGAVIVTMVTARVHPVHLMNAD